MLTFEWYWLFLALPLPLLVTWLVKPARQTQGLALQLPFYHALDGVAAPGTQSGHQLWRTIAAAIMWILLVSAAARPQWVGEPINLPQEGRDIMLAVDLSRSMRKKDFRLNGRIATRLQVVKQAAGQFIEQRQGDRIGLLLFGSRAYLQTPLTFDRQTVRRFLSEAEIGLAGRETAIGDAIGLAVKRLRRDPQARRVLLLLTDGANTAGEVDPVQAARLAAEEGLRIYTVGLGAEQMIEQGFFGRRLVNPSSDLDEASLREIASLTGGRYFRAHDTAELQTIYSILDQLEARASESSVYRPQEPLYPWPLACALGLFGLLILTRHQEGRA